MTAQAVNISELVTQCPYVVLACLPAARSDDDEKKEEDEDEGGNSFVLGPLGFLQVGCFAPCARPMRLM